MFDLIIIGAGPAGLSAAVYAARRKLNFIIISKNVGGQAALSWEVENYLGFHLVSGADLVQKFQEHIRDYKIQLKEESVDKISKSGHYFVLKTSNQEYLTKTIIIATGKQPKHLNIPGEKEFVGKGVSYCSTCDAPLFRTKDVVVLGGGNSAMYAILHLAEIANLVYSININADFEGDAIIQSKINELAVKGKVIVMNKTLTKEIIGGKLVESIKVKSDSEEKIIPVEGVFVEIGSTPTSDFIQDIKKNHKGEIMTHKENDMDNVTSVPGVFAAGDVTDVPDKQIIIAAGEGAKAVLSVIRYLNKRK